MNRSSVNDPALALADEWQRDFPLCHRPFAALGASANLTEGEVIDFLQQLKDRRILGRIGAAVRPNTVGASTLAAMAVPPDLLPEVAQTVNAVPGVNHNYEREHDINLWFVVTAASRSDVAHTLESIERQTGFPVFDLPLERAYHIDLGFRLAGPRRKQGQKPPLPYVVDPVDRTLLSEIEDGLALIPRPYAQLARQLGLSEVEILARLETLVDAQIISRFGCILRHRRLGFRANAMAVWDVPDREVDDVAERLAGQDNVTLCYRRRRMPPSWPFNLFAMIHGRERNAVTTQIAEAELATGLIGYPSAILFSRRCFKQSGARFSHPVKGAA